jgi:hypothetical protein
MAEENPPTDLADMVAEERKESAEGTAGSLTARPWGKYLLWAGAALVAIVAIWVLWSHRAGMAGATSSTSGTATTGQQAVGTSLQQQSATIAAADQHLAGTLQTSLANLAQSQQQDMRVLAHEQQTQAHQTSQALRQATTQENTGLQALADQQAQIAQQQTAETSSLLQHLQTTAPLATSGFQTASQEERQLSANYFNYVAQNPGASVANNSYLAGLHQQAQVLRRQYPGSGPAGGYTRAQLGLGA